MTIGILGGGQLGRMLALAGYPLGKHFRFLDPSDEACVDGLAERMRGEYEDRDVLARFADGLEVVTYEFENVPVEAARTLETLGARVLPSVQALEASQDRLIEKQFLNRLDIPTARFAAVDSAAGLVDAIREIGLPTVLKARRFGYDGKGQVVLREADDAEAAWSAIGRVPAILEALVSFDRELSILAVRGGDGDVACYPLVENHHRDGILRWSVAPAADVPSAMQTAAESAVRRALDALDYVGVLAIEWFEVEGQLLANEMAPRVHNSGHWTIEGAETSQFENHLRAVLGLPLGSTAARGVSRMVNIIGSLPPIEAVAAVRGAHLHLYDKAPRPGRKIGHVTLCATDADELAARVPRLLQALGGLDGEDADG